MKTEKHIVEEIDPKAYRNKDRYSNGSLVLDVNDTGEVIETWTKNDRNKKHLAMNNGKMLFNYYVNNNNLVIITE